MIRVERSALLPYSADRLLALVQDVARYPDYMPGCCDAKVLHDVDGVARAELAFTFAGLTERFETENTLHLVPHATTSLQMRLSRGPFKALAGEWRFEPLSDAACKISLKLELDFGTWSLGRLLAPQIDRAAGQVIQAFRQRAETLYGDAAGAH